MSSNSSVGNYDILAVFWDRSILTRPAGAFCTCNCRKHPFVQSWMEAMPNDPKTLEERILALPAEERARLLGRIMQVLESEPDAAAEPSVAEASVSYLAGVQSVGKEQGGIMEQLDRITQQPGMMGGKACIRGMRVTVGMIVGQIAAGAGIDDLLADYPYLEREDIMQALRYAAWRAEEREVILLST